jgi:prepilin-type N-terminal cleavage/methylation domain-containing protein
MWKCIKQELQRAKDTNTQGGFTLVELIVSVALFTIILTAALGGLLMVIDANRQAKSIKLVVNNLNLATEGMSRELRVGSNFCETDNGTNSATSSCNNVSGVNNIYFTTDRGEESSSFRINNDGVERRIGPGPANDYLKLTGSDVIIDELDFYIRGVGFGDNEQPSVLIVLNGHINQADERIDFYVQTLVSQRQLEL